MGIITAVLLFVIDRAQGGVLHSSTPELVLKQLEEKKKREGDTLES